MKRYTATRAPETVFITKSIEEPVLCVTDKENADMIGPPDPVSNLRPIIRRVFLHETLLQQKLRLMQDKTQSWNQKFWSEHNTKFIKVRNSCSLTVNYIFYLFIIFQERQEYVSKHLKPDEERKTLTADEMSEFYKAFLDKNWKSHVQYNVEWYRRNFTMLFLAFRVSVESLVRHA